MTKTDNNKYKIILPFSCMELQALHRYQGLLPYLQVERPLER